MAAFSLLLAAPSAHAHGGDAAIVLLLPTGYYLAGAALAVAASFILLAILPPRLPDRLASWQLPLGTVRDLPPAPVSLVAFVMLAGLLAGGYAGTRDPVDNPLPATIWTIWWVCFTVGQALTGPLWSHLNPWSGPLAILGRLGVAIRPGGLLTLPAGIGHGIALLQFSVFAWFELVDLAPSDPDRLALAVSLYWAANLAGALVFGERAWMARAEPFSILFGLVGAMSPFSRHPVGENRTRIDLGWPGHALVPRTALPTSGVLFLLLTLSTVSFDGVSRTFSWLSAIGINPLEFPGRSAVTTSSTVGIAGMFGLLSAAYFGAVISGCWLAGRCSQWREVSGKLVYSIVPIALAFQAAHYLTTVLIDGQNAIIAYSDPFALGWNLFGTADWRMTTSFLNTLSGVTLIFNTQTLAIAAGHVVGIVMAHLIALRLFSHPRQAVISQIPLAALMVFYTAFGLWLLSTPRI